MLLTPYLYQLYEFKYENFFNFPNQIQYVKSSCTTKPPLKSVSLSISKILNYAPVSVKITSTISSATYDEVNYFLDSSIPVNYGGYN
jgi:hypothetical protein